MKSYAFYRPHKSYVTYVKIPMYLCGKQINPNYIILRFALTI